MGRLIIQDFVSADGFAADANGEFTIYEHLEGSLDEFNASQLAWLDGIETMVLGTNTYRLFVALAAGNGRGGHHRARAQRAAPSRVLHDVGVGALG